jgi:catechol-2,3-dioxygenase
MMLGNDLWLFFLILPASEAIGHRVANSSEAQAFYKEIGTPTTDAG